jgi:uncharacterized protein involved in exopolysaccharide biosynthesis
MPAPTTPREHLAALLTFVMRLRRHWRAGAVGLIVGVLGTTVVVLRLHRLYQSEALMAWESGAKEVTLGTEPVSSRAMAARVTDMITSRQRLERIIKAANLYKPIVAKLGMVEAVDEMRKHLKVSPREGMTYKVSYDGDTRELARDVLKQVLDDVIAEDRQRQSHEAEESRRFLDEERKQADDDLKQKEAALSAFIAQHPQLASEVGRAASGGLIRAADRDRAGVVTGDVASLEMQAAEIEQSLAALGDRPGAPGLPGVDPRLTQAQVHAEAELQAARADLADKQARLTNEHPDVKTALRRVALAEATAKQAEAALAAARAAAAAAAPTAAPPADADGREAALKRALAAVRQQIAAAHARTTPRPELPKATGSMVSIDTDWTRLNREVAEAQERQSRLQAKEFQADLAAALAAAGEGGRLVIVDDPFLPLRPIAGRRLKVVALGGAGSIFLSLMVMAVFAVFDDHLYGTPDIQRIVDDGIVVEIPVLIRALPPKSEAAPPDPGGKSEAAGG